MALVNEQYQNIRARVKPGDVIAFGGKSGFSDLIKIVTHTVCSHVGMVVQTQLKDDKSGDHYNQIIEALTETGVSLGNLSQRILEFDGEIWWLPLNSTLRKKLKQKKMVDWLLRENHKPYDMPQAIKSALDALDNLPGPLGITHNREDFSKFFCSELVAGGLEVGGAISHLNASESTPIDLCMFNLYQNDYYQLKGQPKEIHGYNSVNPVGWGE
jgi:hypothetical protein